MGNHAVKVHIEHCSSYSDKYEQLKADILAEFPNAEVTYQVDYLAFEVTINGQLVFSKRKRCGFPNSSDIMREIKRASNGESCQEITQTSSNCALM